MTPDEMDLIETDDLLETLKRRYTDMIFVGNIRDVRPGVDDLTIMTSSSLPGVMGLFEVLRVKMDSIVAPLMDLPTGHLGVRMDSLEEETNEDDELV